MNGFFQQLGKYAQCWEEVRSRLLWCLLVWGLVFSCCIYWRYDLLEWCRYLPSLQHQSLPPIVVLSVLDGFYVTFELSFYLSLMISLPYFVCQICSFLFPALFLSERWLLGLVCFFALVLFFVGIFCGWALLLPWLVRYAQWFLPADMIWFLGIRQYVSMFLCVGLYCGFFMELPLLIFLTVYLELISADQLAALRPYVLLGCFVFGMFATPPDMFAQIAFAVPLYLLYEIGIFLCVLVKWLLPSCRMIVAVNDRHQ